MISNPADEPSPAPRAALPDWAIEAAGRALVALAKGNLKAVRHELEGFTANSQ
jgi:hypothetical protein